MVYDSLFSTSSTEQYRRYSSLLFNCCFLHIVRYRKNTTRNNKTGYFFCLSTHAGSTSNDCRTHGWIPIYILGLNWHTTGPKTRRSFPILAVLNLNLQFLTKIELFCLKSSCFLITKIETGEGSIEILHVPMPVRWSIFPFKKNRMQTSILANKDSGTLNNTVRAQP